jgi:hypothetical protein
MADALVEQLRPLGFEKYASRLTRIVGDAMQVVVGGDQVRKNLMPGDVGEMLKDMDGAVARVSGDGPFVVDRLRELGEAGLKAMIERANIADQAALRAFRDRVTRNKGILPTLEVGLGGLTDKLSRDRTGLKSEFEKLKIGTIPNSSTLATGVVLPTGPMMTMSNRVWAAPVPISRLAAERA